MTKKHLPILFMYGSVLIKKMSVGNELYYLYLLNILFLVRQREKIYPPVFLRLAGA